MQDDYLQRSLQDEEACKADFEMRYRFHNLTAEQKDALYEAFRAGWKGGAHQALVIVHNWTNLMNGH